MRNKRYQNLKTRNNKATDRAMFLAGFGVYSSKDARSWCDWSKCRSVLYKASAANELTGFIPDCVTFRFTAPGHISPKINSFGKVCIQHYGIVDTTAMK